MNRPIVLITVPRAQCDAESRQKTGGHPCNTTAEDFAGMIEQSLADKGIPTRVLLGDAVRTDTDLNSAQAAHTEFVARFRYRIEHTEVALHLDVRSYPADDKNWNQFGLVQLYRDVDLVPTLLELAKSIHGAGIPTALNPGGRNFLCEQSKAFGVPATLLEVMEGLRPELTRRMAGVIVAWAARTFFA
jgi:hypothetical protein